MLEIIANTEDSSMLIDEFRILPIEFDEKACQTIDEGELPSHWDAIPADAATQDMGTCWLKERSSLALRVPSAVIPSEYNYLINPAHEDFVRLTIQEPLSFHFDPRLF